MRPKVPGHLTKVVDNCPSGTYRKSQTCLPRINIKLVQPSWYPSCHHPIIQEEENKPQRLQGPEQKPAALQPLPRFPNLREVLFWRLELNGGRPCRGQADFLQTNFWFPMKNAPWFASTCQKSFQEGDEEGNLTPLRVIRCEVSVLNQPINAGWFPRLMNTCVV